MLKALTSMLKDDILLKAKHLFVDIGKGGLRNVLS